MTRSEISKRYYAKHRTKILAKVKAYNSEHKAERRKNGRKYYFKHRKKELARMKVYNSLNREKRSQYQKQKCDSDVNYKIAARMRTRLYVTIKQNGKVGSAVKDLGCSIEEFKQHIQKQFVEGMTWENYGEWHLDHIKPLSWFNLQDREQFLVALNYKNYQPLWAEDNKRKSNFLA